jgi:molecular chaperone DnaK
VKATNGDTHLGGDDWDNALIDWIVAEFKKDSGVDLSKQADAIQRIKEEAEKAKIALSSSQEYEINLPFITADASGPKHIQKKLTRAKLEQLTDSLFERTVKPVKDCLADAKLSTSEVNELVLVGGMTRMPKVIETARTLIGKEPHKGVNPGRSCRDWRGDPGRRAQGRRERRAAPRRYSAHALDRDSWRCRNADDPRNTTIPTRKSQIFSTYSTTSPVSRSRCLQGERPAKPRQQEPRHVPPRRNPAIATWHAADRSYFRHRCERHPPRLCEGPRHR